MSQAVIRSADARDLPALLDIYNYYVVHTPITFTSAPLTMDDQKSWFGHFSETGRYRCVVAARDGNAIGWACSLPFRTKAAYETSVETSVYLKPGETGRGLGKALYRSLLEALSHEDVHRAYGVVTVPNDASVALHMAMGFVHIGLMREAGRKFGRFLDVAWFERAVSPQMFAQVPDQP